jgi:hypothetical protein
MVMVEAVPEPDPGELATIDGGKNIAVTPGGKPRALRDTDASALPATVALTMAVAKPPVGGNVVNIGSTVIEKRRVGTSNAARPFGVPRPVGPS